MIRRGPFAKEVDGATDFPGADSRSAGFAVNVVIFGSQRFQREQIIFCGMLNHNQW